VVPEWADSATGWLAAGPMTADARVLTSDGEWRDVSDMDLPEILDEMDELLAEVTGLVVTPREVTS